MKKVLFLTFLIISISSTSAYAIEQNSAEYSAVSIEDLQPENFFKSPMSATMQDMREDPIYRSFDAYTYDGRSGGVSSKEIDSHNMPLFKQLRLGIANRWNYLTSERPEKDKTNSKIDFKFWKKKNNQQESDVVSELPENSISATIQDEISSDIENADSISLESGISEQITEKQLQLDCDNVNFDEETGDMIATGRPDLFLPPQNTRVIADKMIYNEESNILKAIGNVVVIKDGNPSKADYLEIDINEEVLSMDNIESKSETTQMNARRGVQKDGLLILEDGNFHSDESEIHRMSSRMIGPKFTHMMLDDDEKSYFLTDPRGNKVHIKADRIYVNAGKNHDVFTLKNIEVRRRGQYWFKWPSLTAYTNKDRDYFEANYPEFGTRRKVGMFAGPGFVFGGPNGSVLKAIPFLNYQHDKFGFGGALKYRNTYNMTELGYASASDIFFLRGRQRLDDNLYLQYSANSFMDEWFMGSRMPKYMAEVYYDKKYKLPNFLAEGKGLSFRHRAGFGLMEDNDRNYYGEHINSNGTTTTRLRYMAEIRQALYSYSNPEQRLYFDLGLSLQGSAALYGTGDTQFIARFGPCAHLQYKNWMQDIAYYQAGYEDNSPVPRYDSYRYGHSSLYLAEIIRINKYLSVGWSGLVNMSDDSPNGKLFQENRFVFAIGPDDLKIRLGYDFVRQTTYFGFDVAFDTKGSNIDYGRMEIKNPERLGKRQEREQRKVAFTPNQPQNNEVKVSGKFSKSHAKPAVLQYAQVIDIEDPNMEQVQ